MRTSFYLIFIIIFCVYKLQAQTDNLVQYNLVQLDSFYRVQKQPKEQHFIALAMLAKADALLDKSDTAYASILYKVGLGYYNIIKWDSSFVYLERALDIQKNKIPKHKDYAQTNHNLGLVCFRSGDYTKAEPFFLKALALRKEIFGENHPDYAKSLSTLGALYKNMGNYGLAESFYMQALRINKEVSGEKHLDYAANLNNLGNLYSDLCDYTKAETYYLQALTIKKEAVGENNLNYALTLFNFGNLYYSMGDYDKAESFLLKTLAIRKEFLGEQHPDYGNTLNSLGVLYSDMGNISKSELCYLESIAIRKKTLGEKHPEYANSLINLGVLYNKSKKNRDKAESLFLEALSIQKEVLGEKHILYATTLHNLARCYFWRGDYEKSAKTALEGLAISKEVFGEKHLNYGTHLSVLGHTYEYAGNYQLAQSCYVRVITLYIDFLEQVGNTLGEKAKKDLFKDVGTNLNVFNSFMREHSPSDSLLIFVQNELLFTKGYALTGISELLPFIKNQKDTVLNKIYEDWVSTKYKLGKAYEMSYKDLAAKGINLDSLKQLAAVQETELMRNSATLRQRLGYDKRRFYYKDLLDNLGNNEVSIDFMRFETKDTAWYYALITQQNWQSPKYIPLCTEKQLEFYALSEVNPSKENYITKPTWSKELYNLLIKPLEPYLKKKKIIHWAPVGLLNQLAMNTLQDSKGKMLGQKMEIHQYGSLKDFIIKKTGEGSTDSVDNNVLLVGDIAFDLDEAEHINLAENSKDENVYAMRSVPTDSTRGANRFIPLKGTKIEIENLNQAFTSQKWRIEQLQQKDALEEKVREFTGNKTPKVLHFATHGFFIPAKKQGYDNPLLRSGIALAGANRVWMGKPRIEGVEDGLWTAYEIANIDLSPAELVVLSACETAKGQIDPHEGVLGLQRSFKIAGVENMLLSLWQVPDKETVELMQEFYKHYLNGETPSVSLRKAQDTMRKKYPDPYYWAAFILIE